MPRVIIIIFIIIIIIIIVVVVVVVVVDDDDTYWVLLLVYLSSHIHFKFITKRDKFYYKLRFRRLFYYEVRQVFQSARRLLQSATEHFLPANHVMV